jgi:hypothetical protein
MARQTGKTSRGALAEGAEKFERIARTIKDDQLARTKTGPSPPVSEVFVLNPNEAWARKYMTHCIGPVCFGPSATDRQNAPKSARSPPESRGQTPAGSGHHEEPIGFALGKPAKRRSWIGRLLRGR